MHEIQMHEENCFLTLTYNNENLPKNGSLNLKHFQLFMKRLRKKIEPRKIKFYHCGEYGDKTYRPHYHAIIFGYDFPDKKHHKNSPTGEKIYISKELDKLWEKGHCTVGNATFESAGYVARYILKKVTGKDQASHYERIDPTTGEIINLKPEYASMSNGIGKAWLTAYKSDVYPTDEVIVNGKQCKPPKYYDRILESSEDPKDQKMVRHIKAARTRTKINRKEDNTPERLEVKEKVKISKFNQLKRGL